MAAPAARLVLLGCSDDDGLARVRSGTTVDEALRGRRRPTAAVAHGLQLVHELGVREQLGHRAERQAAEVLIQTCDDDARPAVCELERARDDAVSEELRLVDPDDSNPAARSDRSAADEIGTACMRAPAWLTTSVAS